MYTKREPMSLREIQIAALEILKEIDRICNDLKINYYLWYGSLLGAVRHKGFIPWDDDLDIAMKIEDYKVFIDYFRSNKVIEPFEIHNFETNKYCGYNITRVCDNRYVLEFNQSRYTSGIFVDIYPLEGLGNEKMTPYWKKHYKKLPCLYKHLALCCTNSFLYGKNIVTKIGNIPNYIISNILGKKYYIDKLNSYPKIAIKDSKYIGIPAWDYGIFPKEWFNEIIKVPFEGIMVPIPRDYDLILRSMYNDYMKLPSDKERVPHHNYVAYRKGL